MKLLTNDTIGKFKLQLITDEKSDATIEKYIRDLDVSDIDAILKILEKKKFLKTMDFDEKNKIKLYCVRKGFLVSDVNKAIKIYEKGEYE